MTNNFFWNILVPIAVLFVMIGIPIIVVIISKIRNYLKEKKEVSRI